MARSVPNGVASSDGSQLAAPDPRFGWPELGYVLAIFAVSLAIRGYSLGTLVAYPDELTYAARGVHILANSGAWIPSDMWDQPPLFNYLLAGVIAVGGGTLDALRLVSAVAGSVTVVVVYFLGRSMYGRLAGVVASVALAVDGFDILYSRLVMIEAVAIMFITLAILFFYEGLVKKKDSWMAAVGGLFLGLALDSKYIALVVAVGFLLFLAINKGKFAGGFPRRQSLIVYAVAAATVLPVLLALAAANANPFYYDLVYRFQQGHLGQAAASVASGSIFLTGFTRFSQTFFHVSSTSPFQVFSPLPFSIVAWAGIVAVVIIALLFSFLSRRNKADGLLFVLFFLLLAFAFTYPDRRVYFSLYPAVVFLVMMGHVAQKGAKHARSDSRAIVKYGSVAVMALIVTGVALNAAATPSVYQKGFGDWDEMTRIMTYVNINHSNNSYLATTLAEIGYYVRLDNINVSLVYMKQAAFYSAEPPLNQSLQTPVKGIYPIFWVISPASIEKLSPQFIVMPNDDYQTTTTSFRAFIAQRYYQPLDTKLILIFQIRP